MTSSPPIDYVLGYPEYCQICGKYMGDSWSTFFRICEDCELARGDEDDDIELFYEFK